MSVMDRFSFPEFRLADVGILVSHFLGQVTKLGLCGIGRELASDCPGGRPVLPGDQRKVTSLYSKANSEVVEILGYYVNRRIWSEI